MKNVDVEVSGRYVWIDCRTAKKACAIVELVTMMDHRVKTLERPGGEGPYAQIHVYVGSEQKAKMFKKHVNSLNSV